MILKTNRNEIPSSGLIRPVVLGLPVERLQSSDSSVHSHDQLWRVSPSHTPGPVLLWAVLGAPSFFHTYLSVQHLVLLKERQVAFSP
jgi:hypothetical protein